MNDIAVREETVRAAMEVIDGSTEPLRIWAPLLLHPISSSDEAIDHLLVSRVRAFPIFFGCLKDLAAATTFLAEKQRIASSMDCWVLARNVFQIALLCRPAIKLVTAFDEEEQVYLSVLRDRFVHGYLKGRAPETRRIKIASQRGLTRFDYTKAEINGILRSIRCDRDDGSAVLDLMERYSAQLQEYVASAQKLLVDKDSLERALRNDWIIFAGE